LQRNLLKRQAGKFQWPAVNTGSILSKAKAADPASALSTVISLGEDRPQAFVANAD
jgi:hypothetical protein